MSGRHIQIFFGKVWRHLIRVCWIRYLDHSPYPGFLHAKAATALARLSHHNSVRLFVTQVDQS